MRNFCNGNPCVGSVSNGKVRNRMIVYQIKPTPEKHDWDFYKGTLCTGKDIAGMRVLKSSVTQRYAQEVGHVCKSFLYQHRQYPQSSFAWKGKWK